MPLPIFNNTPETYFFWDIISQYPSGTSPGRVGGYFLRLFSLSSTPHRDKIIYGCMLLQACVAWMAGVKKGEGREEEHLERKKGEGACTMVVSYLIHVNKLLIVGQAIRHLRTPAGQGPQK